MSDYDEDHNSSSRTRSTNMSSSRKNERIQTHTVTVIEHRNKEKKEFQALNDRLARYIEKVQLLEVQNRKLSAELEALKAKIGKEGAAVKALYEDELNNLRNQLQDAIRTKSQLEAQASGLQDQAKTFKKKFDDERRKNDDNADEIEELHARLVAAEADETANRERADELSDKLKKQRAELARLTNEWSALRLSLDEEQIRNADCEAQVKLLEDEIEFLKKLHEQELNELRDIIGRDNAAKNKEFFRDELAKAIRDIRKEYDDLMEQIKLDMEMSYKIRLSEMEKSIRRQAHADAAGGGASGGRSTGGGSTILTPHQKEELEKLRGQVIENKSTISQLHNQNNDLEGKLRDAINRLEDTQEALKQELKDKDREIAMLREECDTLLKEYHALIEMKSSLSAELAIYRTILEGEENRTGLRQIVERAMKDKRVSGQANDTGPMPPDSISGTPPGSPVLDHGRVSVQRNSKGNIIIADCNALGKYIVLENSSRTRDENLSRWRIVRKIEGRRDRVYHLPEKIMLKPNKSCKIWARAQGGIYAPPEDLIFDDETSWGTGHLVHTILYNADGEERATHTQRMLSE